MFQKIQQAIIAVTLRAQDHGNQKLLRRAALMLGSILRKPATFAEELAGLQAVADQHHAEVSTWISAEDLAAGRSGPFDACDLRHWLVLAKAAGVPAIPAREVLRLNEAEMELASGTIQIPDNAVTRNVRKKLTVLALSSMEDNTGRELTDREAAEDALLTRLCNAMDDVPEGWMVRSHRCGSSELKSLAGAGIAGPELPEIRFGANLEIGPGWVRVGNRRRVNASDNRTVESYAHGPGGDCAFLARPRMEAARYAIGEDPHRHGTPFAGKGMWPAEWRAFVEKGEVVGVASYYGWCGSATAENARMALEVRRLAQRIVDEAKARRAYPRLMEVEFIRQSQNPHFKAHNGVQDALALFGREDVACTLDFLEVKGMGLMLLEGGPANTPFGGGHPCAFAGNGGTPTMGNKTITHGVAFRLMPHVTLAEPKTWTDADHEGCILSWVEAEDLSRLP